jgi:glycosyltransferase involved in cell wall biosynthesis
MPTVSVIIPTLDSAAHLARCLASICAQKGVETEIIVVDQSSTDRTIELAKAVGARVLRRPRPRVYTPPTASRNLGARHARGTYLLHLDADMELSLDLLATCVERCSSEGHVALVLHEVDVVSGFWGECKALERRCYRRADEVEAARFVRAETFRAVGGYDESLGSGEDWDVHRRYARAGSVGDVTEPVFHHLGRLRPGPQLRKKFAYGRSGMRFLKKREATPIAAAMLRSYWISRGLFRAQPLHTVGFLLLRGAEAAAVLAGIGVELLAAAARFPHAAGRSGRTALTVRNAACRGSSRARRRGSG